MLASVAGIMMHALPGSLGATIAPTGAIGFGIAVIVAWALLEVVSAVVFTALFLGGLILRPDEPVWATILLIGSVPAALHALLAGWASGRGPR